MNQTLPSNQAIPVMCDLGDDVPGRVQLLPWGTVEREGEPFTVDEVGAAAIVAAFRRQRNDLVIDYEHQSLGGSYSSPDGTAPAAGWIKDIESVPGDGIYAAVSWTPKAAEEIAGRVYRYLSPVILVDENTGQLEELHSVALVNRPAIRGMRAIVNKGGIMNGTAAERAQDKVYSIVDGLKKILSMQDEGDPVEMLNVAEQVLQTAMKQAIDEQRQQLGVALAIIEAVRGLLARRDSAGFPTTPAGRRAVTNRLVNTINQLMPPSGRARAAHSSARRPVARPTTTPPRTSGRTYVNNATAGSSRQAVIEQAVAELKAGVQGDPKMAKHLSVRSVVNDFLREKEMPLLTDAEAEQVERRVATDSGIQASEATTNARGRTTHLQDRQTVINSARMEYDGMGKLQNLCGRAAFINEALRGRGLPLLSEKERLEIPER